MGQRGDFVMSEGWDSVSGRRLSYLVRLFRMLEGLPGMLVSSLVLLFAALFTGAVGVGGDVMELGGPLMVFVMGSVVVSRRHGQRVTICPDLECASFASS